MYDLQCHKGRSALIDYGYVKRNILVYTRMAGGIVTILNTIMKKSGLMIYW